MTKVCRVCGIAKATSAYASDRSKRDGLGTLCRPCAKTTKADYYQRNRTKALAQAAEYRAANADKIRAQQAEWRAENKDALKRKNFETRYSISWDQREQMLADQGGRCANPGCRTTQPGGRGEWHMDHDHACCPEKATSCGKCLRGLLCSRCNVVLGYVKDDPDVLRGAAVYLADPNVSRMRPVQG